MNILEEYQRTQELINFKPMVSQTTDIIVQPQMHHTLRGREPIALESQTCLEIIGSRT